MDYTMLFEKERAAERERIKKEIAVKAAKKKREQKRQEVVARENSRKQKEFDDLCGKISTLFINILYYGLDVRACFLEANLQQNNICEGELSEQTIGYVISGDKDEAIILDTRRNYVDYWGFIHNKVTQHCMANARTVVCKQHHSSVMGHYWQPVTLPERAETIKILRSLTRRKSVIAALARLVERSKASKELNA